MKCAAATSSRLANGPLRGRGNKPNNIMRKRLSTVDSGPGQASMGPEASPSKAPLRCFNLCGVRGGSFDRL